MMNEQSWHDRTQVLTASRTMVVTAFVAKVERAALDAKVERAALAKLVAWKKKVHALAVARNAARKAAWAKTAAGIAWAEAKKTAWADLHGKR